MYIYIYIYIHIYIYIPCGAAAAAEAQECLKQIYYTIMYLHILYHSMLSYMILYKMISYYCATLDGHAVEADGRRQPAEQRAGRGAASGLG